MHHNTFIGRIAAVATVALGLLPALAGDIIYVKAKGGNTEPYDTEATAATTLDTAVAYANAQGIRKIKVVGTITQNTQLTLHDVEIFGDGWDEKPIANLNHSAGSVNPVFVINANVLIHGIKFTADHAYLRSLYTLSDSSSVISNCWFSNLRCNTAQVNQEIGGRVSAGLVTHCLFTDLHTNNGGESGTGVFHLSGTARMANSVFTGCYHKQNKGGLDGLLTISGNAVLENCVVFSNTVSATATMDKTAAYRPRRAAGICVRSGSPTIRNCIVRDNLKPHAYDSGAVDIYSPTEQGNFYIAAGATPTIENCNIPEGQVPAGAVNCQTGDPLFETPSSATSANRDFHIKAGSPCIDAGKLVASVSGTDYYLNPRVAGYGVDIGANEYALPTPELDIESSVTNAVGRQVVDFTAVDRAAGSTLPTDWTFTWTVDGEEQASTVSTMSAMMEPGTHTIGVAVGNQSVIKTDFITIEQAQGVEFLVTPTPYAGFQLVDLSGYGSGGTEIQAGATYTWYWRKAAEEFPATPCTNGNDLTAIRFDDPGAYCFKLVVLDYDGKGGSIESTHDEPEVAVVPASVSVGFSETTGEGRTLIDLSATANGFTFDDDAVFEWRWATGGEMPAAAQATGNPAVGTFFPGTWTVQLIVTDADGAGTCFTNTIADAVAIADGADYYVSGTGDDASAGTKASPYKTLAQALAQPAFGTERKKIGILGTVTQDTKVSLADVEIYGEGWDDSGFHHTAGYVAPALFSIGENVMIHGLKFTSGSNYLRAYYQLDGSSSVISNCWFSGLNCVTVQPNMEIAGRASAGLITHCLYSGISSDNGGGETLEYGLGLLSLYGTARMVNSVFTGNHHSNNARGPNDGVLTVAGDAVLENCVIYDNYAKSSAGGDADKAYYRPRRGGGVCVRSGSPTIRNCIIRKNRKPHTPSDGKYPTETEEDIYNPTEEGDIYIAAGATPTITNCNMPEGQVPDCATNCQTGNPKFANPDAAAYRDRDFSIAKDSPCRNAGANKLWQRAATDYTGVEPRRQGGKVDIGAYEYPDGVAPVPPMLLVR